MPHGDLHDARRYEAAQQAAALRLSVNEVGCVTAQPKQASISVAIDKGGEELCNLWSFGSCLKLIFAVFRKFRCRQVRVV
jgi:hypothetical protein